MKNNNAILELLKEVRGPLDKPHPLPYAAL